MRPRRRALLSRAARRGVRPVRWRECAKARPRRVGLGMGALWNRSFRNGLSMRPFAVNRGSERALISKPFRLHCVPAS